MPMVPLRRRLAPTLTILALLSTVSVIAIALPGCGSSSDETSGTGTVSSGHSSAGPAAAVSKPASGEEQAATKPGQQQKGGDKPPSEESTEAGSGEHGKGKPKQRDGHRKGTQGTVCPSGMSRAECKERIEAATGGAQTPSGKVSPSNCTDVMTKQQCEEVVRAQKDAERGAGTSASPETCLEEYSREFCEERFGEQAERQAGQ